jgi:ribonuclease R
MRFASVSIKCNLHAMSKNRPPHGTSGADPHAERESAKYDNPIPSREYILQLLEKNAGPLDEATLAGLLALASEDQREGLRRRLIAMRRDGQLIENRRGALLPVSKADLIKGRVIGHPDGFGFVTPASGGDDLYLHNKQMRLVFHGDEVLVRQKGMDFRGRPEAAIVEILQRNTHEVVGRYFTEGGAAFVRPDNKRITQDVLIVANENGKTLQPVRDQIVVVRIVSQPDAKQMAMGVVTEVLGDEHDPGLEIDIAVRNHGIPFRWPAEVLREAALLPEQVRAEDLIGRVDLRQLPFVTIDGEDARDFDDAVYAEPQASGGWILFVAIADVSHYVKVDSALDEEARNRGTSVYFPGSVVPMLPEKLSNGLCSLNPQVDRLCLVCRISLSKSGVIQSYQFMEAVFHSHARLTYTQVAAMLAAREHANDPVRQQHANIIAQIDDLYALYQLLLGKRKQRGAIEFETQETRILFDANKKIEKIIPVVRNEAHRLIEECMLAANTCAGLLMQEHLVEKEKLPALFRVHEGPTLKKLENLHRYLGELGLTLHGGEKPRPEDYQLLLQQVSERPDANVLQTMLLRSMSQAVYQQENIGHFGLNYPVYTHFTSPIRRYPDLLVHRAIRYLIRNVAAARQKKSAILHCERDAPVLAKRDIYPYDDAAMLALGEHCSLTERRADEASRDVQSWLKCEYLQDHVGASYRGVISSVVSFGFFVELRELYVEGLVHVSSLQNDYYRFDAPGYRLLGERSGQSFKLGDEVQVKVIRVDLDERKVDFELEQLLSRPGGRISKKKQEEPAREKKPAGKKSAGKSPTQGSRKKRPGKKRP